MASIRCRLMYLFYNTQATLSPPPTSIPELRLKLDGVENVARMPKGVTVESTRIGGRPAEWLRPEAAKDGRTLLYLHGGGYCIGSCRSHRALAARIAMAARSAALLLEYRLGPEHPFPAGLEDAVAAMDWLAERGVDPGATGLVGDSGGGGLVLSTAVSLRDAGKPLPAALACLSPWADLTNSGESFIARRYRDPLLNAEALVTCAAAYIGGADARDPLVSPLFADLSGLPPLLIQAGERELLLSDAVRLADAARAAGVQVGLEVWKDMGHDWHVGAGYFPEAQRAIERVGAFLDERLSEGRMPAPRVTGLK